MLDVAIKYCVVSEQGFDPAVPEFLVMLHL